LIKLAADVTTPTDQQAGFDPTTPDSPRPDAPAPSDGRADPPAVGAPHPDNPPWGVLAGVGVALGMFALMLVLQLVFTVPYVFQRVRSGMTVAQAGEVLQRDPTYILLAVLSMLPAHLLTLLLAWAVVAGFGKRPFFASLGWSWSPRYGRTELLFLLGAGAVMFAAGQLLGAAFGSEETTLTRILASSAAARYAVAAFATLTAPLVEEVVFRGVLYSAVLGEPRRARHDHTAQPGPDGRPRLDGEAAALRRPSPRLQRHHLDHHPLHAGGRREGPRAASRADNWRAPPTARFLNRAVRLKPR
jgi:membrane protease YdiL (CAAX protease family)